MTEEIEKVEDRHVVLQKDAQAFLDAFESFEIEDSEDYEVVGNGLKEIALLLKNAEAGKKEERAPFTAKANAVSAKYKPALDILDKAKRLLKKKMADYNEAEQEKSRLAMEAAAEAAQEGDFDKAHEAAKDIVAAPKTRGITHRHTWEYSVRDVNAVPREYLSVDHSHMKILCREHAGQEPPEVPGIVFHKKTITTVRTS